MTRALWTRAATLVASLVAVAAIVGPGVAVTEVVTPPVKAAAAKPSIKYVALGSSYAAGPDTEDVDNLRCLRTSDNYPHQVAAARGYALTDVSCSSSTTANILRVAQRPFADRPQIDAVTPDTRLVTVTTGGNDIDYIGRLIAESCTNVIPEAVRAIGIRGCHAGRTPRPEPGPDRYVAVERSMIEVAHAVHARAPHAKVVFVDYPPVLGADGATCPLVPLNPEQAAETVRIFNGLAAATARAAHATGSILVTASKAGAAHTACSVSPWLLGFELPVPYHPTELGKTGVAQLVLEKLPHQA
ncbi:SGNH/GDSL hydrolase family protein [Gordonia sp. CPCC 205515]|uniref:SGNH/GDSL hydrolase family protein n=1 Tax=Gordonia sp. CPCC 205515 TaxID=3140791 RepID=UPI003AF39269